MGDEGQGERGQVGDGKSKMSDRGGQGRGIEEDSGEGERRGSEARLDKEGSGWVRGKDKFMGKEGEGKEKLALEWSEGQGSILYGENQREMEGREDLDREGKGGEMRGDILI